METWVRERVLQRYIIENFAKFKINDRKIVAIRDNKDQFPDLYCLLENNCKIILGIPGTSGRKYFSICCGEGFGMPILT